MLGRLDPCFKRTFGVSFTEAIAENPNIGLIKKPTKVEKQREDRQKQRKVVKEINENLSKTVVMRYDAKYF